MSKYHKLSAVIITYNEEQNIGRCIDSLWQVADEVVVVDSFSTDRTEEICRQKNVRFIQHPFEGHIQQKNYAVEQAQNEYVLSLDADEELDDELENAILREKKNFQHDAYSFNRLNNYCGQWIRHCGWSPDKKIRIWNKNQGRWGGLNPHDRVVLSAEASLKHLKGNLRHYSFSNVNEHISQIHFFTDISAQAAYNKGKRVSVAGVLIKAWFKFLQDYFLKLGFLDGYYGLVICINSSYAKFLKYLKLRELNRGKLKL